jgi:hypothetical protein
MEDREAYRKTTILSTRAVKDGTMAITNAQKDWD